MVGREALYAAAIRRYDAGEAMDISSVAAEVGISRATAYRWLGDNDHLLAEVWRRRTRAAFREVESASAGEVGRDRVLLVMGAAFRRALTSKFQTHLHQDPARMLRIVASRDFPNQRDLVTLVQGLLDEEINRGHLKLQVDSHSTAYAIVRLGEAFLYADVVAGEKPDVDKALEIIALVLA